VPAYAEGGLLFAQELTYPELSRRFDAGARIIELPPTNSVAENPAA
jgi:hypothetical protein